MELVGLGGTIKEVGNNKKATYKVGPEFHRHHTTEAEKARQKGAVSLPHASGQGSPYPFLAHQLPQQSPTPTLTVPYSKEGVIASIAANGCAFVYSKSSPEKEAIIQREGLPKERPSPRGLDPLRGALQGQAIHSHRFPQNPQ